MLSFLSFGCLPLAIVVVNVVECVSNWPLYQKKKNISMAQVTFSFRWLCIRSKIGMPSNSHLSNRESMFERKNHSSHLISTFWLMLGTQNRWCKRFKSMMGFSSLIWSLNKVLYFLEEIPFTQWMTKIEATFGKILVQTPFLYWLPLQGLRMAGIFFSFE